MADGNIDDILMRLNEIERLQSELRHLVPRTASISSSRHQDLSRDSPASTRFPSLFTFPVISNFASAPKNKRVEKSTAQLNLNSNYSKSSSGNRQSTVNLKAAERSVQRGTRETNGFKNLLRSSNNIASHSRAWNPSASTSVANSRTPTRSSIANRLANDPQRAIKKKLKSETSKTATGERSNVQLSRNENTSDMRIQGREAEAHLRSRHCERNSTLIERIMEKLNYCFVNDRRVTVPYYHPEEYKYYVHR